MKHGIKILVSLAIGFAVIFGLNTALADRANADTAPADHVRSNRYLPICEVEDASSGPVPCVWPAFAITNLTGHSFRVYRRTVQHGPHKGDHVFKYITDRRAFELVGGCDSDGPLFC